MLEAALVAMMLNGAVETLQVTASRSERSLMDVAAAVSVIDRDQIDLANRQTLPDLLRGQAGVFVQQTTPGQGVAIVRGLKGSEVLHLVDGMRLNHAFFRNAPNQYLALVDPLAVDQIEVVRGPSPTLYGADAMGGVINIRTRTQRFDSREWETRMRARTRWSTAEGSSSSRIEIARGHERLSFAGGVSYQDFKDRRAAGDEQLTPTAFSARAADARLAWAPGDWQWTLNLARLTQPSTPRYDQLVAGFGQNAPAREEFSFEPSARSFGHLHGHWDAGLRAADTIDLHLAHQRIDDDTRRRSTGSRNRDFEQNRSSLSGLVLEAVSQLDDDHTLSYGIEAYDDEVRSSAQRLNLDSGESSARRSRFPNQSTMRSFAAWVHHEASVSPRNRILIGVRGSRFEIDLPGDDARPAAAFELNDFTGNVAWQHRLNAVLSLSTSIGRGFRPPNVFDLGALGPRPGNRFNEPNPDIGPESVWTADLGLKSAGRRHFAELFVFHSDYRDKISSMATGRQTVDGEDIVRSENLNEVKIWGVEGAFRLRLAPLGEGADAWARGWSINASANWVHGEETATDGSRQPADRIPPLSASLGLGWRPNPRIAWELNIWSAGAQTRLSQRDQDDPRIDPSGTPGFGRLSLSADWQLTPRLRALTAIDNLLDKRYREHASGIDAPGRDVSLMLEWLW